MSTRIHPRALNACENYILCHLLSVDFPGAGELLSQVDSCEVTSPWAPDSVSVDFRVPGSLPAAPIGAGPIPVRAVVLGVSGDPEGEILIWTEDGYLSALEYAWYGDEMPRVLPATSQIEIV